ncbi:hypothetical protein H9Q70_005304 [Fusarium xylarioides]|nr:hypothetical protein H9Q70_005304 [Fusarium xylarioides]KAG5782761.1 hypothetical protein H9Q73_003561 [Fusarium xylarioides]KAG5814751.1 hypothetical protein H9Q71_003100 [Fusarium xylarioides]KAG5827201.1 hypothetical protein H9Q74_002723 [Fusarium xylarioides]
MFIQDFDSFYADVNAIAQEAESQADLYKRLEIRRDQRLTEVCEAMVALKNHRNYYSAFSSKDFGKFRQLMRCGTLGHLVRFIASLLESTNRTPIPSPSRSPSPLRSEDAMTQPEPDEIMGIGPTYSSEWSWETSAERGMRMRAEGKIILRQAPNENTEHVEISATPITEGQNLQQQKGAAAASSQQRQPEPRTKDTKDSNATGPSGRKSETGRKAKRNQDDAENGTIMPRHNDQNADQQQLEPVEEPRPGGRHRAKKTIKTTTKANTMSKWNYATTASEESQLRGPQKPSTRAHPLLRKDEAEERESDNKRKRAIDDEQDAIETQAQPNSEPSPRRRVKARKVKSTMPASATTERPRPRRSARLSSSK